MAEAGGLHDSAMDMTVSATAHVLRSKLAAHVDRVLSSPAVRVSTQANRLQGCSHARQMSLCPVRSAQATVLRRTHDQGRWLCRAQICNRWLTLRMQLISVVTQLIISMLVLVFRWPRDPGAPHAHLTIALPVLAANCVQLFV